MLRFPRLALYLRFSSPCRVSLGNLAMFTGMRLGSFSVLSFTNRRIDTELWARKTSVTLVYGLCQAYDGISHDPTYRYGRSPCPKQRNPRSGSIGHARYRCWGPPGCRCRWRAAHLLQPLGRQRTKSLSVRRKSLTSAWRRSMSSTGRTSDHLSRACN